MVTSLEADVSAAHLPQRWGCLWEHVVEAYPDFTWLAMARCKEGRLVCGQRDGKYIYFKSSVQALQSRLGDTYLVQVRGAELTDEDVRKINWKNQCGTFGRPGNPHNETFSGPLVVQGGGLLLDSEETIADFMELKADFAYAFAQKQAHAAGQTHVCDSNCADIAGPGEEGIEGRTLFDVEEKRPLYIGSFERDGYWSQLFEELLRHQHADEAKAQNLPPPPWNHGYILS
jgi:hypothetical protein